MELESKLELISMNECTKFMALYTITKVTECTTDNHLHKDSFKCYVTFCLEISPYTFVTLGYTYGNIGP